MLLNHVAEGRFSAIAASFNPTFKRDCRKSAAPLNFTLEVPIWAYLKITNVNQHPILSTRQRPILSTLPHSESAVFLRRDLRHGADYYANPSLQNGPAASDRPLS